MLDSQFGADSLDKQKAQLLATMKDDPKTGAVKLPDDFVIKYAEDSVWNRTAKSIDGATALFDKYPIPLRDSGRRADGRLSEGPRVVKSSGFAEFDSAAIQAVRRAAPFPAMTFSVSMHMTVTFDNPVIR